MASPFAVSASLDAYHKKRSDWEATQKNPRPGMPPAPEPVHPMVARWSKLRTGRDLRTVAVLSHDEEGKALHLWRAHSLRPAGDGSVPKVIEEAFVKVSGITAQMLKNKQEELIRLRDAEVKRREDQSKALLKRVDVLKPLAGHGDVEAKAEIDRLLAQRTAIWAAPIEEQNALFIFGASFQDESHYHDVLVARSDPMAAYVAPELRTHLSLASLPELLR